MKGFGRFFWSLIADLHCSYNLPSKTRKLFIPHKQYSFLLQLQESYSFFFIYVLKDVSKVIKAYRVPVTISLIGLVFIYWLPKCGPSAGRPWYSRGTTVTVATVPFRLSTTEHERDVGRASLHIFMSGNKDLGVSEASAMFPRSKKAQTWRFSGWGWNLLISIILFTTSGDILCFLMFFQGGQDRLTRGCGFGLQCHRSTCNPNPPTPPSIHSERYV